MNKLSLESQCQMLSLPLDEIELSYSGKPEPALLQHFETQGYIGSSNEGITFHTVLKALMLDKLAEINTFNERADACTRYLEAQLTIHKDKLPEIIGSIENVGKQAFCFNLKEILQQPFIKNEYPSLSFECCEALFDAIDLDTFTKVAEKFSEDPYTYRSGWPDLTLVKGSEVRFVEVKTTDKLHKSQLVTIPVLRDCLPFDFSVYRVKKLDSSET